jgi:phosphohistidine swiveling domain-containing protein
MRRSDDFFNGLRTFCPRAPVLGAAVVAAGFAVAAGAFAASPAAVHLEFTVPIPVGSTNTTKGMYSYDISSIDQTTQTFYLSDRSNKAIDVVDASKGTFTKFVTATPAFAGVGTSTENSGPNGNLTTTSGCIVASDAGARIVSFTSGGTQVSDLHVNTNPGRLDEMAFDPTDSLILVNNPFPSVTKNVPRPSGYLISITSGCTLKVVKKIPYPFATNGAEAPDWDPATSLFYVSIPQIGDASEPGSGLVGEVIAIDPKTETIVKSFHVTRCQPAGNSLNTATGDLLLGCSVVFDSKGDVWSGYDTNEALPIQVVFDPTTGVTKAVKGVGASDEVTYNSKDGDWYTGSNGTPYAPNSVDSKSPTNTESGANVLGVIDGTTDKLLQLVPTFEQPETTTHPSGSGHSVAANDTNGWVFVPSPANFAISGCSTGCIQIFER